MKKPVKILTRQKIWLHLLAILILALLGGFIVYPTLPAVFPAQAFLNKFFPHLGLDLQGGAHLVYQADVKEIAFNEQGEALAGVRDVIERRVNAFGVSEPVVQTTANNRLIVELPGVYDVNEAIKKIGETPLLEFKEQLQQGPEVLNDQEKIAAKKYNEEQLAKAKEIIEKLNQGADFSQLAKDFSEDPGSKESGGELGFAKKGQFVQEFEKALFEDLAVGQITPEPIKSAFGYHVIQKEEEKNSGDAKEVRSRHILLSTKNEELKQSASEPSWLNTKLSGKNLKKSVVEFDPNSGQPIVSLEFDSEGKELFAQITKRNIQKQVAIFLDGSPISIPTVQEEITQGRAIISGSFNINEAKLLAQRLNAGALPVPIFLVSQQTVGPSLGKISLEKSLIAGLIGLILVALFMIIYYRLLGFFAVIALLIYTILSFAIFEIWPVTLTLSGIAGFILSIGMAVDANVLIFERVKEELYNGKTLTLSIEEGFNRAWPSIRDSNISSLITCAILTWFGSSLIKGFAITLGLGILVSMFTAINVSRTFLRVTTGKFYGKHLGLFGAKIKNN